MAPQAFQPPEPFSLNDLFRRHCRDRLYVHPLDWTAQHLQLLNCRFLRRRPIPQPEYEEDIDRKAHKAARRLASSPCWSSKDYYMEYLLNDHSIYSIGNSLDLYFAGRRVAKLPCHIYGHNFTTPLLAYIADDEIDMRRKPCLQATFDPLQPIIIGLQDPYLVGILIALAQARWFACSDGTAARPCSYTVHLFVIDVFNYRFLRVYTATITAAFLRKFDQPSVFSDSSLVIRYVRIPFLPVCDLKREIAVLVDSLKTEKRLGESPDVPEPDPCMEFEDQISSDEYSSEDSAISDICSELSRHFRRRSVQKRRRLGRRS